MVLLIPGNTNPTMADIDTYIHTLQSNSYQRTVLGDIIRVIREIQSKSGAGALLHPAEEYFLERATSV